MRTRRTRKNLRSRKNERRQTALVNLEKHRQHWQSVLNTCTDEDDLSFAKAKLTRCETAIENTEKNMA